MTAEEDEALYEAAKTLFYNSSEEDIRAYQKTIEQLRSEIERLKKGKHSNSK